MRIPDLRLMLALTLSLIARIPLITLPAAGRDEATYAYWAFHPEAAYSPLLQIFVRLFHIIPLPDLLQLRMTSIAMSTVCIVLFDMFLKRSGVSDESRYVGVLALALSPWLIYSGSILHPDMLLLFCILAFMLAVMRDHFVSACLFVGLAFWAKLSGLVLLPAAAILIFWKYRENRRHAFIGLVVVLVFILPIALQLSLDLLMAISEFGKMDSNIGFLHAISIQLGQIILLGGPALILGFVFGLKECLLRRKNSVVTRERLIALIITFSVVLAFGFAMIVTHQVKGNWLLPAIVLMWPRQIFYRKQFWLGLALSAIISAVLILFFAFPVKMQQLEQKLPALAKTYSLQAGTRETRVSPTRSWSERVKEYRSYADFAAEIKGKIDIDKKRWLVCDDYGLAAQLLFVWGRRDIKLIIPGDKLFYQHMQYSSEGKLIIPDGAALVGSQASLKKLTGRQEGFEALGKISHPFTDGEVELGCVKTVIVER
ncbi:MAG: ArnT family glycosyltransferase [Calditrichia bacterium]